MKNLILLVILSFFIVRCGPVGTSYFPLDVGNKWNHTITATYTDTTATPDSVWADTGTRTVEIIGETTLDNGTKVLEAVITEVLKVLNDTITYTDTLYYQETGDYLRYYYDKSDEDYYYTELDLPIEEGKTWTAYTSFFGVEMALVLGKEDVTVPAGDYNDCWKIGYIFHNRDGYDTTYVYYAEGVGMLKRSQTRLSKPATTTTLIELESATIK